MNKGWKIFALGLVALSAQWASARVCVYQDSGFRGASICYEAWQGGTNNLVNTGMNDQISSIEITEGETVTVYQDADYRGASRTYSSNVYNLSGDFNDIISSIYIQGRQPPPPPPPSGPGDQQICFYTDAYFQGTSFCMNAWDRPIYDLRQMGLNDQISSIRIPYGVTVTVFQDINFQGQRRDYTSDVYNLSGDFNDIISSIYLQGSQPPPPPPPPPGPGPDDQICFYTDAYFQGASFCRSRWDGPIDNLNKTGFNDRISSIRIPYGVTVTVFENSGFQGQRRDYTSDVYNLAGDFNDTISSISIQSWGR
jgi:hypothetical protein